MLDLKSLHLRIYADASFENNSDLTSQLSYIVLLCDGYGKCNILHYGSYKSRRVTRSVLGAEVYALADAFDHAYAMRYDLEIILGQRILLQIFTDSMSLFDMIFKNSTTAEHRLMIDMKDVRESYEYMKISNCGFILSKEILLMHSPSQNSVMNYIESSLLVISISTLKNGLSALATRNRCYSKIGIGSVSPFKPMPT